MENRLLRAVVDFFDLLETRVIGYLLVDGVALLGKVSDHSPYPLDRETPEMGFGRLC